MSDVWQYFQKIASDNEVIVSIKCQICGAEYGALTSTTTLRRHLNSTHSSVYTSNVQQREQSVQKPPYTLAEQKHITTKLVMWITVDLQPFNIVEQEEFQEFIYTLDPRYVIPCRQTIKDEVNSLFLQRRTNIKLEINNFASKIALTSDIWSSNYNNSAFLGITMHYINSNWELKDVYWILFL